MKETTQQDIYEAQRDINKAFQNALTLLSENQEQLLKEVKDNRECLEKTTNFSLDISKELLKASKILKDMNNVQRVNLAIEIIEASERAVSNNLNTRGKPSSQIARNLEKEF